MPPLRLTKTSVDKIELTQGKTIEWFDTKLTGFGVRAGKKNRTYFVQCPVRGKRNEKGRTVELKVNIGRVGIIAFDAAQEQARKIIGDAAQGITPKDIETERLRQAALEAAKDITVKQALDEYCSVKKRLKDSTKKEYLVVLTRYIGDWLDLPIREITPDMVVRRHTEIGEKSPSKADYVGRILRAACNHVIEAYEDVMVRNPVKRLSTLNAWYRVERRRNYITPSDLGAWIEAISGRSRDASDYYLGLLFTGARKTELSAIRWSDINFSEGTAVFRTTKNGDPLLVPICSHYLQMLRDRMELLGARQDEYVFPSDLNPTGHIVDIRDQLAAAGKQSGVTVTHHDLRRSFLSYADEVGISPYAIKRLCNHALPQDVTEGYLQFSMDRLRRDVEKVANFILSHAGLKESAKVIPFTRAA